MKSLICCLVNRKLLRTSIAALVLFVFPLSIHAQPKPPGQSSNNVSVLIGPNGQRIILPLAPGAAIGEVVPVPPDSPPLTEAPPAVVAPKIPPVATPTKPLTPEELARQKATKLMQELMRIRITQRNPSHMLSAWAKPNPISPVTNPNKPTPPTPPTPPTATNDFQQSILSGDWPQVKKQLAQLPTEMRKSVFDFMLKSFQNPKVMLLPDEVLDFAKAYDQPLETSQVQLLGRLIQRSIALGSTQHILARLNAGVGPLGGKDTTSRANAARLLIAAGLVSQSQPFLPSIEDARKNKHWDILNLHAQVAHAIAGSHPVALMQVWKLSEEVLQKVDVKSAKDTKDQAKRIAIEQEAINRMLTILPLLPTAIADQWLTNAFVNSPPLGRRILAHLSTEIEQSWLKRQSPARLQAMKNLSVVVNGMLKVTNGKHQDWVKGVRLLSLAWIREAQKTISANPAAPSAGRPVSLDSRKVPPMTAAQLLPTRPNELWMKIVGEDVSLKLRYLVGMIGASSSNMEVSFDTIQQFLSLNPSRAHQIVNQLLQSWSKNVNPNNRNTNRSYNSMVAVSSYGYFAPSYYNRYNTGIPLTNAQQKRNLMKLSNILNRLREIGIEHVQPNVLVDVFARCHSDTEVYKAQDIQAIFGDTQNLPPDALHAIVSNMRQKLASQWRNIKLQQQRDTKRTDKQIVIEIRRGYEIVNTMLTPGIKKYPSSIPLSIDEALIYFDRAEFEYGQNTDIENYIKLREHSFATFNRIAKQYNQQFFNGQSTNPSADIYIGWFRAALGASDLSLMTRQDVADKPQLRSLITTMHKLPPKQLIKHIELFGKAIDASLARVPAHLKPRFMREALKVIGNHKAADNARKLIAFYDDLISEVQLHTEIDGASAIGHNKQFGVHLSIRYTQAIARVSGGFNKYLRNNVRTGRTNEPVNFKDDLEKYIRDTLSETFEVDEIRFHSPLEQTLGFGRPGWRQTPLAYIVLRAKDPSVDQIPSLKVDADFNDANGYVILPITSQVIAVDAKLENATPRPLSKLEITQVLDDRKTDEDTIRIEIMVKAHGIIPELSELLNIDDSAMTGFKIDKILPNPMSINKMLINDEGITPQVDRNWVIELKPVAAASNLDSFTFPLVKNENAKVIYQRYADADIIPVTATVSLNMPWASRAILPLILIVTGVVFVVIVIAIILITRRKPTAQPAPKVLPPKRITPFSTVAMLRRLAGSTHVSLSVDQQAAIQQDIHQIENDYFTHQTQASPSNDQLTVVIERWAKIAG